MKPERILQNKVMTWLRFHRFLATERPNHGYFNAWTNRYNIVGDHHVAGLPDIEVFLRGGRTVFIELKSKDGKLSPAQEAMLAKLAELGFEAFVARDVETVQNYFMQRGYIKWEKK